MMTPEEQTKNVARRMEVVRQHMAQVQQKLGGTLTPSNTPTTPVRKTLQQHTDEIRKIMDNAFGPGNITPTPIPIPQSTRKPVTKETKRYDFKSAVTCSYCKGSGFIGITTCKWCRGSGKQK